MLASGRTGDGGGHKLNLIHRSFQCLLAQAQQKRSRVLYVRRVAADYIHQQTGSYGQATYAIQDTPDIVAEHHGRFLQQDKSALAVY